MADSFDAVVVGAGPNGLAAAITIAAAGLSVLVVEAEATIGGGARTSELTLPGYRHDVCSAIHPMAVLSPFLSSLPLAKHGLEWIEPDVALAHPLDDGTAACLERDLLASARAFGPEDDFMWRAMHEDRLRHAKSFFADILEPIRIPRHPLRMASFGATALQSAERVARTWFENEGTRALFAGCAAHSMMPLDALATASFGMVLGLSAHATGWPLAKGGSSAIVDAMAAHLVSLGGVIETNRRISKLTELPAARAIVLDVMPRHLATIAGDALPASYRAGLRSYRHGPGVFKVDWALDGPIPWTAEACRRAGTVHVGPRFDDVARCEAGVHRGEIPETPFVLVAQQSVFDPSRAPAGKHTGWAYCHVPHGSTVDMTSRIEAQIERFAPGFRDLVLATHTMNAAEVERHNVNNVGGDIGGGANDFAQFLGRPVGRWNPYATPNPRLFLASSATPPGGGVHGMSGHWAARAALKKVFGRRHERSAAPSPASLPEGPRGETEVLPRSRMDVEATRHTD